MGRPVSHLGGKDKDKQGTVRSCWTQTVSQNQPLSPRAQPAGGRHFLGSHQRGEVGQTVCHERSLYHR